MRIFCTIVGAIVYLSPLLTCVGAPQLPSDAQPEIRTIGDETGIYWRGDKLVELKEDRELRIRASGFNDHWIGTAAQGMDLGWASNDLRDYSLISKSFKRTAQGFELDLEAVKPSIDGRVTTRLEGFFVSPELGFRYVLSSRIAASQEKWRLASHFAKGKARDQPLYIRPLNFHLNRITPAERASLGNEPGDMDLYDGIVVSEDGDKWRFVPKSPVPYVVRPGLYETTHWNQGREVLRGQRVGYLDRREGGWMTEMLDSSSPLNLEMCWMFSDVHHRFREGIPAWKTGQDRFKAHYSLAFTPLSAPDARLLLDRAEPISWRDRPEYQLPVFGRFSTFDRLIAANNDFPWIASTYDCAVDNTVGYDDSHSIRIAHQKEAGNSAWYAWTWGPEYETMTPLNGAYRFSAMVKTENCTGAFRLAVSEFIGGSWHRNGRWSNQPIWTYSEQQITGTTDWTRIWIDLPIDNEQFNTDRPDRIRRSIVLQYEGVGTIWFDNVRIHKID